MNYEIIRKEKNISGDWSVGISIKNDNTTYVLGRLFNTEPTKEMTDTTVQGFLDHLTMETEEDDTDN